MVAALLPTASTRHDATPAPCDSVDFQRFRAEPPAELTGFPPTSVAVNGAAVLPGADPALRHEYVVIGAHYDHVGRNVAYARDAPYAGLRPGADDNASGTAALLELARAFANEPIRLQLRMEPVCHRPASYTGCSDQMSFQRKRIPALHFFTGLHGQYHSRSDRIHLINFAGMLAVTALVERVVREVAHSGLPHARRDP